MKKHCSVCGKKVIKGRIIAYHTNNGKPVHNMFCPSNICGHTGCSHDYDMIKLNLFQRIWYMDELPLHLCSKCGIHLWGPNFVDTREQFDANPERFIGYPPDFEGYLSRETA